MPKPNPKNMKKRRLETKKKKSGNRKTAGIFLFIMGVIFLAYLLSTSPPASPSNTITQTSTTASPNTTITTTYTPPPVSTTPLSTTQTNTVTPAIAPDFTLQDDNGKPLTLSTFRGRVVVLEFMSTTCPHCQNEMAALVSISKAYGSSIVMISVDLNPSDTDESLRNFTASYGASWMWARDTTGVSSAYHIMGVPAIFIINANDLITASFSGETSAVDLSQQIQVAAQSSSITITPTPPVAPDFTLQDDNGKPLTLSTFRGRVVVLEFMSTTCPHCQNEMAALVSISKAYGSSIVMISVDLNPSDTDESLRNFTASYGASWMWARDTTGVNAAYSFAGVPHIVIINANGLIIATFDGETSTATISQQIQIAMKG